MTEIKAKISELLQKENIELFASLKLSECSITKKYLLDKAGIENGSVIIMAVPYLSDDYSHGNISEYAKSRDYHLFFKELFERLLPTLRKDFGDFRFEGFADHSPIDEKHAAAIAGLGILGKNSLLITQKYSSFVFLGEIVTSAILESDIGEVSYCENCGKCLSACPASLSPHELCISALTQKKGELSDKEKRMVLDSRSVWGCDICQKVCPHTATALNSGTIFTSVPFFMKERIPKLTYRLISEMNDNQFSERAYAWRGREVILRNLSLFQPEE